MKLIDAEELRAVINGLPVWMLNQKNASGDRMSVGYSREQIIRAIDEAPDRGGQDEIKR